MLNAGKGGCWVRDEEIHTEIMHQSFELAPDPLPTRLHSSVGRASHRYCRGHGFKSCWSLRFFSGLSLQLLLKVASQMQKALSLMLFYSKPSNSVFSHALIGYSSLGYPVLVYTKPSNSVFHMLWLATQARDILHYPLVCKTQWMCAQIITLPAEFWLIKLHFMLLAVHWFGLY